jgi:succinyl-CoA synthetase alpha subunit
MGHAGAIISGGSGTAAEKIRAFEKAGVPVARIPSEIPGLMALALKKKKGAKAAPRKAAKKAPPRKAAVKKAAPAKKKSKKSAPAPARKARAAKPRARRKTK